MTQTHRPFFSTRPIDHAERARCVAFAADLRPADLPLAITVSLTQTYQPAADVYTAASIASTEAASRVAKANETEGRALGAFKTAFYEWTAAIDHAVHRGYSEAVLPAHLGGLSFSAFVRWNAWDKIHSITNLFLVVSSTPSLVGDAATFQGIQDATSAFRDAVRAREDSLGARAAAVGELKIASKAFDSAWGDLVRAIERHDPTGLGPLVPRFHRVELRPA